MSTTRTGPTRIATAAWALASVLASTAFALAGPAEDLKSESVEVRRAAALALRNAPREARVAALPDLCERLKVEKDGQVRLAVLDAVTGLGPDAAPAVDALAHTLRTNYGGQGREEMHQDYRAALALASIGGPAVEALRSLLSEKKESVRAEVVMALGRIGPDAAPAVPDLAPLLGDGSDRLRSEAIRALGRIGGPAVDRLIAACSDEDPRARSAAVEALGFAPNPDPRAAAAALAGTRDDAPEVRAAALRTIARLRDAVPEADALAAFRDGLARPESTEPVRLEAVDGLLGRPALLRSGADDLEALLTAPGADAARHAAFLLGRLGPDAAPRLLRALADDRSPAEPIAEALARVGRPAVPALAEAATSPSPHVRTGAVLALGRLRPPAPGTVEILSKSLKDPDPGVSAAGLAGLGGLGPRAAPALGEVRAVAAGGSDDLRAAALDVLALAAPRDSALADDLLKALDDPSPAVRRGALRHLGALGTLSRKALPAAIARLSDDDEGVRAAAADFLGDHGPAAAEAVPALTAMLTNPPQDLQILAAQTLAKLGRTAQSAFEPIAELLESPAAEVREAAALALGSLEMDAEEIRPRLAPALRDEAPAVRKAALRTVQRFGPKASYFAPDVILMAVQKDDRPAVERMIKRLERRGPDPRTIPELAEHLGHADPAVRLLSIKLLALAGAAAEPALPTLERLREDPDADVRNQAKDACERIKSPSPARPAGRA